MEDLRIMEIVVRYSTIFSVTIAMFYTISLAFKILNRDKEITKSSIITDELHTIFRSIVLIFISFYILQFLVLVEIGATDYIKNNPNATSQDYFKYILDLPIN